MDHYSDDDAVVIKSRNEGFKQRQQLFLEDYGINNYTE